MTVGQLIAQLTNYDLDFNVIVEAGHEGAELEKVYSDIDYYHLEEIIEGRKIAVILRGK